MMAAALGMWLPATPSAEASQAGDIAPSHARP